MVDLGGNIGLFALDVLQSYPSASVTSIEADPTNLPILNACQACNPEADWTIIAAAAGTRALSPRFGAGDFADSPIVEQGGVEVPMVDAFDLLGDADFIKIDIEGGEWPILLDERFRQIRAAVVVIEWHAAQAPPGDARQIVLSAFSGAGYQARAEGDNHHGLIWGLAQLQ